MELDHRENDVTGRVVTTHILQRHQLCSYFLSKASGSLEFHKLPDNFSQGKSIKSSVQSHQAIRTIGNEKLMKKVET